MRIFTILLLLKAASCFAAVDLWQGHWVSTQHVPVPMAPGATMVSTLDVKGSTLSATSDFYDGKSSAPTVSTKLTGTYTVKPRSGAPGLLDVSIVPSGYTLTVAHSSKITDNLGITSCAKAGQVVDLRKTKCGTVNGQLPAYRLTVAQLKGDAILMLLTGPTLHETDLLPTIPMKKR